jgi:peptide/nickel transport system substrate-binding protein
MFADRRVREALEYALDRPAMLAKAQHGLGELAETDQSPTLGTAYDPTVPRHPYSPERARALLDAAGWRVGPDGVRVRNGQRFAFTMSTQVEAQIGQEIETQAQAYWHDIGAQVTLKNAPTSAFFDNTANGVLQGGKYDVATFAWSGAPDPDDSAIYSGDNFAPHGQNALFWNDRIATAAMNDALATVDWKRRVADYHIVQHRLASQVPTIVLWFRHEPQVYNDDLKGFSATPVITTPFWKPERYSL